MGYCFMDIKKIKSLNVMAAKYKHNYREITVPNAVPELSGMNRELVPLIGKDGNPVDYNEAFKQKMESLEYYKDHKLRSNAVLAYEIVTTFSHEDAGKVDVEKWQEDNVKWLKDTFNLTPENGNCVLSVMYHGDEYGNVHCHSLVVPVNEWNRFLKSNPIAHKKVREIRMYDLEDFFMQITTNHAITYKRLTNVKSMLNGLFKYGIRIALINDSPMHNVDFAQFQTRCKPENSVKDIYTLAEREAILQYLSAKTDIYSFAVQLAFYLCVRVGELITLKKSDIDIQDNKIYILRSARKQQILQDDLTFSPVEYTVEERIKGNKAQGFRFIPLTPQSKKLIEKIMDLYPDGDYLFMRNGHTLYTDSFNRYLKDKVCMPLKIPYRSSHQIRFTVATLLYEAGIPINQISAMLGHSETRTTMHYIRQQVADSKSRTIMSNLLDI